MISVDALLFDLDGTLVDSRRDLAESIQFLQREFRVPVSSEKEVARFVGDGMKVLVQRAIPSLSSEMLPQAIRFFIRHYAYHCLDHTDFYPGVREILWRYRDKKMAVVTNKPERVSRRILNGLGLGSRFPVVIGGDSLRNKKPSPDPVRAALFQLKIAEPRRAVMIGDGVNDVLSGRAAGTWTCAIPSEIGDPHRLLNTFPDLTVLNAYDLMRIIN